MIALVLLILVLVLMTVVAIQWQLLRSSEFVRKSLNDSVNRWVRCSASLEIEHANLVRAMRASYNALMVKYEARWLVSGSDQVERAGRGEQTDRRTSEAGYQIVDLQRQLHELRESEIDD